jgi:hypothetical protein
MWTSKIYFIFMLEFYKLYLTTKAKICLKCFKFGERKIEDNYIINGRVNGTWRELRFLYLTWTGKILTPTDCGNYKNSTPRKTTEKSWAEKH